MRISVPETRWTYGIFLNWDKDAFMLAVWEKNNNPIIRVHSRQLWKLARLPNAKPKWTWNDWRPNYLI